jgi:GT2 family glycosyltransferase
MLSAYVVHFDAPRWCEKTVAALGASVGVDVRVTLVHNGGEPPLLPAGVDILRPGHNAGFAGGANVGLRAWLGDGAASYAVICSHDAYPEPSTLLTLAQVLDADDTLGAVGPGNLTSVRRHPPYRPGEDPSLSWLCGSLIMLRREAVQAVGGFDERFGSYVEDVELGYRLSDAGWGVVAVPEARAFTAGSASESAWAMTDANWQLLAILRARSLRARTRLRLQLLGLLVRSLAGAAIGSNSSGSRRYARERARALRASFARPTALAL